MDVVGAAGVFGSLFSRAGGNFSGVGGGGCIGGDASIGEQSGFDGGGQCAVVAWGGAWEVLVGGGALFSGGGTVGVGGWGKEEGGGEGGGVGVGGGDEF